MRSSLAEDTERLLQPEVDTQDDDTAINTQQDERLLEGEDFTINKVGERQNGWTPLLWSFGAAASITVSHRCFIGSLV